MTDQLTPRERAGAMTLTEAAQYLPTGIRRLGWQGHIRCSKRGLITFVSEDGFQSTWYAYQQDLAANDWEVVNHASADK